METTQCILCNKDDSDIIFRKAIDINYRISGNFNIVQCKNCGLVYLNPRPSISEISTYYPGTYYTHTNFKKLPVSIIKRGLFNIILKLGGRRNPFFYLIFNRNWRRGILKDKVRLLDIGCGNGKYLHWVKSDPILCGTEIDLYGIEPDKDAVIVARETGAKIFQKTLLEANFPPDFFDVVALNNTFEHLHNPLEILKEVKQILKPSGFLKIEVPNMECLEAKIFEDNWIHLDTPRHMYFFTPKTLKKLVEIAGFKIDSLKLRKTKESALLNFKRLEYKNRLLHFICILLNKYSPNGTIVLTCKK